MCDYTFYVMDPATTGKDFVREEHERTGANLYVEAYEGEGEDSVMVDDGVVELFPQLEELGLSDICEGAMEYRQRIGPMSATELAAALVAAGFKAVAQDSP